jgi:hypothetical protein
MAAALVNAVQSAIVLFIYYLLVPPVYIRHIDILLFKVRRKIFADKYSKYLFIPDASRERFKSSFKV